MIFNFLYHLIVRIYFVILPLRIKYYRYILYDKIFAPSVLETGVNIAIDIYKNLDKIPSYFFMSSEQIAIMKLKYLGSIGMIILPCEFILKKRIKLGMVSQIVDEIYGMFRWFILIPFIWLTLTAIYKHPEDVFYWSSTTSDIERYNEVRNFKANKLSERENVRSKLKQSQDSLKEIERKCKDLDNSDCFNNKIRFSIIGYNLGSLTYNSDYSYDLLKDEYKNRQNRDLFNNLDRYRNEIKHYEDKLKTDADMASFYYSNCYKEDFEDKMHYANNIMSAHQEYCYLLRKGWIL